MADAVAKPLLYIKSCGDQEKLLMTGKKSNIAPIFQKGRKDDHGNYWPFIFIAVLGKMTEQILLEAMVSHMDEKEVIWENQYSFTKGRSCLTNLVTFYDGATVSVVTVPLMSQNHRIMSSIWT